MEDNEILDEDLITYDVYSLDGRKGKIEEIFMASKDNKILRIIFDKEVLVPMFSPMIKEINKKEKKLVIELIDGMM